MRNRDSGSQTTWRILSLCKIDYRFALFCDMCMFEICLLRGQEYHFSKLDISSKLRGKVIRGGFRAVNDFKVYM